MGPSADDGKRFGEVRAARNVSSRVLAALRPPRGRCRREIVTGSSRGRAISGFFFSAPGITFSTIFAFPGDAKIALCWTYVGARLGSRLGGVLERSWEVFGRPRRPQDAHKTPQDGHKTSQDATMTVQDGSKTRPRCSQAAPKTHSRRLTTPPRRMQEAPRRLQDVPRCL